MYKNHIKRPFCKVKALDLHGTLILMFFPYFHSKLHSFPGPAPSRTCHADAE